MCTKTFKAALLLCLCAAADLSAQPVPLWETTFEDCTGAAAVVRSRDVLIVAGNHVEKGTACLIGLSEDGDLLWKHEVVPPESFTSLTITSLALSPVGAAAAGWVEDGTGSTAGFAMEITRDGTMHWRRTYRHDERGVLIRAIGFDYTGYTLVGRIPDTGEGFVARLGYDGTSTWTRAISEADREVDVLDTYTQPYIGRFVTGTSTDPDGTSLFLARVGWNGEIGASYPVSTLDAETEMAHIVPGGDERVFLVHGGINQAGIITMNAESGAIAWERSYEVAGDSDTVRVTSAGPARQGGFFLAGYRSASGEQDAVVTRFDSTGAVEWEYFGGEPEVDERFDDVLGSRDGRIVVVGSQGTCTGRHCGTLRVVAFQEDIDLESYYPLAIGNAWTYMTATYNSEGGIDTLSRGPLAIEEAVTINDTLYYIAPHPFGSIDTLRTDLRGRIWSRWAGRELLQYDFSRLDGEAFFRDSGRSGFEDWDDPYYYWRFTPVVLVHVDEVETYAGEFKDAVLMSADMPPIADDELVIHFAAGVGMVRAVGAWSHLWLLAHATVDGRSIPSHVEPPRREHSVADVYPNPARGRFTIRIGGTFQSLPVTITIIDVLGRQVGGAYRCMAECTLHRDTEGLSSGTYFVRIEGARRMDVVPVVVWK